MFNRGLLRYGGRRSSLKESRLVVRLSIGCLTEPTSARAAPAQVERLLRCYNGLMPELSRFFGIIIRMYAEFGASHHTPHFHAYYQDDVAVFRIDPVDLISGSLPKRQQRLVEAWAELHQAELLADWQQLQAGRTPQPIAPLR